jgi:N-acetylmuramoyl-L-alanine amidase
MPLLTRRALAALVVVAAGAVGAAVLRDDSPAGPAIPAPATTTPPKDDSPWPPLGDDGAPGVLYTTPGGVMAPITADRGDGTYEVQTPCDGRAVVTGFPLAGAHVVLDPGHGGDEPGAIGPNGL